IDVGVGQPDGHGVHTCRGHLVGDQAGLLARVDDGAFAAGVIDDEVAVFDELPVGDGDHLHDATPAFSRSRTAVRYFSIAIAAVVASAPAVVIGGVSWLATPPAANKPGIEVIIRSSVMKYPPASCCACPSTSPELGWKPTKMNTPPTARVARAPVAVSSSTRWSVPRSVPLISTTRLFQTISILGFANARSWMIFDARSRSRRWTMYTLVA